MSNLASTAVNANILPASAGSASLGSSVLPFDTVAAYEIDARAGGAIQSYTAAEALIGYITSEAALTTPTGAAAGYMIQKFRDASTGLFSVSTEDRSGASSAIEIASGNSSGNTAGTISIIPGTGVAFQGSTLIEGQTVQLYSETNLVAYTEISDLQTNYWGNGIPTIVIDGTSTAANTSNGAAIIFQGSINPFLIGTQDTTSTTDSANMYLHTGNQTGSGNAGAVEIDGGNALGAGHGGSLFFSAGSSATGTSGSMTLLINPGGAAQGTFSFLKSGVPSVVGQAWIATGVDGQGYWGNLSAASGSFVSADAKTITVLNGVITSIV